MNIEPWERNYRSSRSRLLFKISVLKNFANFTGKHLCWSVFSIKLQIWRLANLLWRDTNTGAMKKKLQKQSFADVLQNRCSKKFRKFHRKIPVLEYLFNKVAGLMVFFLEVCEIFKNTFFTEHIWYSCRFITY